MSDKDVLDLPGKIDDAAVEEYNDLVNALGATGGLLHYEEAQSGDVIDTADCTDLATSVALVNELKAAYTAHIASTAKHAAADATNTVSAADATDVATVNTLANEMKVDLSAHVILAAPHRGIGGQGSPFAASAGVTTADGTDAATSYVIVNALKAALNLHVQSGAQNLSVSGN